MPETELEEISLRDAYPQLSETQKGYRESFEWLYFDLELGDDKLIFIPYLGHVAFDGRTCFQIEVIIGGVVSVKRIMFTDISYRKVEKDGKLDMIEYKVGDSKLLISNGESGISTRFDLSIPAGTKRLHPKISGSFEITTVVEGFKPRGSVYVRNRTKPDLFSACAILCARHEAKGALQIGSAEMCLDGFAGYFDHPWGTIFLPRTHAQWHWARAYTRDVTVLFMAVQFPPEYEGFLTHLLVEEAEKTADGDGGRGARKRTLVGCKSLRIRASDYGKQGHPLAVKYPSRLDISIRPPPGSAQEEAAADRPNGGDSLRLRVLKQWNTQSSIYWRNHAEFVLKRRGSEAEVTGAGLIEYYKIPGFLMRSRFLNFFIRLKLRSYL